MRKKRPFDGFIRWIIGRRYSQIGFFLNFKAVLIFKFLNLYAQPVYLWGAHASGSLNVPVSKVLSGTWGTARAAQLGSASRRALLLGTWGAAIAAQRGDYLCSPVLGAIMRILTYTAKRLLLVA
jgi:hypothetical protein